MKAFQKKIIIILSHFFIVTSIQANCLHATINPAEKNLQPFINQSKNVITSYCTDEFQKEVFSRLEFAPICRDLALKKIPNEEISRNRFDQLNCERSLTLPNETSACREYFNEEIQELVEIHQKISDLSTEIDKGELLNILQKSFTHRLVLQGRRASGTGKFNAYVFNNLVGLSAGMLYENFGVLGKYAYEVCIEQVYSFLDSPEARYLKYKGYELTKFDETEKTDTSGKTKHAFVLVRDPEGNGFVFDTWIGKVTPYIPDQYSKSKGEDKRFSRKKSKYY